MLKLFKAQFDYSLINPVIERVRQRHELFWSKTCCCNSYKQWTMQLLVFNFDEVPSEKCPSPALEQTGCLLLAWYSGRIVLAIVVCVASCQGNLPSFWIGSPCLTWVVHVAKGIWQCLGCLRQARGGSMAFKQAITFELVPEWGKKYSSFFST